MKAPAPYLSKCWLPVVAVLGFASLFLRTDVSAVNVSWGSTPFDNLYDSSGAALDASFTFEIGKFANGFVPTYSNMVYWADNWQVFDRATNGDGWDPTNSWFTSVANLESTGLSQFSPPLPAYVFAEDDIGYMWIYNSLTFDPLSEWALIGNTSADANASDDWLFPNPADQSTPTDESWTLLNASEVIVGGLNNVQGDGTFSASPGTFSLQTSVVPEPGSVLLLAAAGLLLRLQRGRSGRRLARG